MVLHLEGLVDVAAVTEPEVGEPLLSGSYITFCEGSFLKGLK